MQLLIDIFGFFICGFIGFIGGYLFRKVKEDNQTQ